MIGIPLGLMYANVGEWLIHKHILHGLGKDRKNFWSFHWHDHHAKARKHEMIDDQYTSTLFAWEPQTKELAALIGSSILHIPLFPVAPFFTATLWYSGYRYYTVHKRAHLDHDWAKDNLPWHYDHHMGRDQNANWCVTKPWADIVFGTRKEYVYGSGVPQEVKETRSKSRQLLDAARDEWRRARANAYAKAMKTAEPERPKTHAWSSAGTTTIESQLARAARIGASNAAAHELADSDGKRSMRETHAA